MIGVAQEKASAWRGWRAGGGDAHPDDAEALAATAPSSTRTADGRRLAVFFTKTHTRILCPSLAELEPTLPAAIARDTALGRPWREFDRALNERIADATITA